MKTIVCILIALCTTLPISAQMEPFQERKELISDIIHLTETNICNPAFLETNAWVYFLKNLHKPEVLKLDDEQFASAFNQASRTLPFTHFYISVTNKKKQRKAKRKAKANGTLKAFELSEVDDATAVLTIRRFIANGGLMQSLITEIKSGKYKNLIIDLRDNGGGTLDAAVVLGQFLTPEMIDAGSYLSRSWFDENGRYPTLGEIQHFPFLTDMSYSGFKKAAENPGFRMVIPPHTNATFEGKVYVLTNDLTASTCEPFVHLLKEQGVAEIIGEKTAGAMLSGSSFTLKKNMQLFIPVQDYVTAQGTRLDKLGVTPTVETTSEKAMETALSIIKK